MAAKHADGVRGLAQVVRVHVVVRGAHREMVAGDGVVLDAADVGLQVDVQGALVRARVPHLHLPVVAAAH